MQLKLRPIPGMHKLTDAQKLTLALPYRSRERGIASIEAAIMLPLMCLVFAGVLYVAQLISAAQHSTRIARSCAWRVAVSGCEEIPPDCPESSSDGASTTKSRLDQAGGPTSLNLEGLAAEEGATGDSRTESVLGQIGARLNEFFLDRYEANVEEEFEKSQILGGETVTIDKSFSLPCNSKPSAAEGLADALFNDFSPPEKAPEPERFKDPHDHDSDF